MDLKSKLLIVYLFYVLLTMAYSQDCGCKVAAFRRVSCPFLSPATLEAGEEDCRRAGCCFDGRNYFSLFNRIPKCFQKQGVCPCDIPVNERENCEGVFTRFTCLRLGCCFNPTDNPPCYRRADFRIPTGNSILLGDPSPTSSRFRDVGFWGSWRSWTSCSNSCSTGQQTRKKQCFIGDREVAASQCVAGESEETRACNTNLCQNWSNWQEVGMCSGRCGQTGSIEALRTCTGFGSPGNAECSSRTHTCSNDCSNGYVWSSWYPWSSCSERCTSGTRIRQRACTFNGVSVRSSLCMTTTFVSYLLLRRATTQTEACNDFMCNQWSSWSRSSYFCVPACGPPGTSARRIFIRSCSENLRRPRTNQERERFEYCSRSQIEERCSLEPCLSAEPAAVAETDISIATTSAKVLSPPTVRSSIASPTSTFHAGEVPSTAELSSRTTTISTTSSTDSPSSIATQRTFTLWSSWSVCSQRCGPGLSRRRFFCFNANGEIIRTTTQCRSRTEQRPCNTRYCERWSDWVNGNCVANCNNNNDFPEGFRNRARVCLTGNNENVPSECYRSILPCDPGVNACSPPPPTTTITTSAEENRLISTTTPTTTLLSTTTPSTTTSTTNPSSTTSTTTTASTTRLTTTTVSTTSSSTTTVKSLLSSTDAAMEEFAITERQIRFITPRQLPSWSTWGEWSVCSQTCGSGERSRFRTCDVALGCAGSANEVAPCNVNYCNSWSSWRVSCSSSCNGGQRVMERFCEEVSENAPADCSMQILNESCNTIACDENLDILFLIDSTDFVDNCRQLRRNDFETPITSEFVNDVNTPVYARIKDFVTQFAYGWRSVGDDSTRVAIQLMSRACSSSNGRNFFLEKSFNDSHENFVSSYIDPLPYRCGSFFLDLALTCAERRTFSANTGDRMDTPNVIVALISRPPAFAQPNEFLLSAVSQRIVDKGTTIISMGITQDSSIRSSSQLSQYRNLLSNLACPNQATCPTYIGSIWDETQETPAERIRRALAAANA